MINKFMELMEPAPLAIQFLEVSYRCYHRTILTQINFSVNQGDVLVLLGRSGSGKTTILKLINHLLKPTQGEVLVQGKLTTEWNAIQLRRQIGYVIQEIGLFPHLTVAENVAVVPKLAGWKLDQIKIRVQELLELVGLEFSYFGKRYPHQLSGGQRQRVGVARALAADPPILLMDEPFGALDPLTRLELQQEFKQLQQQLGKTVVFVTHDVQEAFLLASRIGLMQDGRLIELDTPANFIKSQWPEAKAFLECLSPRQFFA